MQIYHEIAKGSLPSILTHGIKRGGTGGKTDSLVRKTDEFLDQFIPEHLVKQGLSRTHCVYGYIGDDNSVINIRTGKSTSLQKYLTKENTAFLHLKIDKQACFISDLDLYDRIKVIIQANTSPSRHHAATYWSSLVKLMDFAPYDIKRPEVMIPYSVPSDQITVLG